MKISAKVLFLLILTSAISLTGCSNPSPSPSITTYTIDFDLNGGSSPSYTGSKQVNSFTKDIFFFDCVKEDYNFRGWSYNDEKIFDEKGVQLADPVMSEHMTFVAIFAQTAKMDIEKNIEEAGTVSGMGEYPYNTFAYVKATPNKGYSFVGWYFEDNILSNHLEYVYKMVSEDVTLEARFEIKSYNLHVISSHPILGEVMIEGDVSYHEESIKPVRYLDEISIEAKTINEEYKFLGWYDSNNNLVTTNAVYTFVMVNCDYNLYAKWDAPSFDVTVYKNNDNAGTITGAGPNAYNSTVTLTETTNDGYEFVGWYKDGVKLSSESSYSFVMPYESVIYDAEWSLIEYNITYELDGGAFPEGVENPSKYTVEDTITLNYPTKAECIFNGWIFNGKIITQITAGTTGDITLVADWSANSYDLTVISNDTSKGTATGSGTYQYNSQVTIEATPNDDHKFFGWYIGKNLLSKDNPYTFTMPNCNYELTAIFMNKQEEWNITHGVTPVVDKINKTATYGLYPQTVVDDTDLINALNSLGDSAIDPKNGWYYYNNGYFTKVVAKPSETGYKFDNGKEIVSGTTYWFSCEVISWDILSFSASDDYYLLTKKLLDAQCYYNSRSDRTINGIKIHPNNYKYSDLRAWLNYDFYNSAFALGNTHIKTITVDNSAATTDSPTNPYVCENTEDKIFLPSHNDYNLYFNNPGLRECKTTDYARARGSYSSTDSSDLNNGAYWTRSPYSHTFDDVWGLQRSGGLYDEIVNETNKSVRPSISLTIA